MSERENLQKMFDGIDAEVDSDMARDGVWTLGQLIDALEKRPQDERVVFDFCRIQPGRLSSYRGYYRMLAVEPNFKALHYDDARYQKPISVAEFVAELKAAVGREFTGYKGGEFTMDRDTWMWVSEYGHASETAVCGVEDCKFETIIKTRHVGT